MVVASEGAIRPCQGWKEIEVGVDGYDRVSVRFAVSCLEYI